MVVREIRVDAEVWFGIRSDDADDAERLHSGPDAQFNLDVNGAVSFVYPCKLGDVAKLRASLGVQSTKFNIPTLTATGEYFCGVSGADEPVIRVTLVGLLSARSPADHTAPPHPFKSTHDRGVVNNV